MDAVKGKKGDRSRVSPAQAIDVKKVELFQSEGDLVKLQATLIGELKCFDTLAMIGALYKLEGWSEIRFGYLGGLAVQLDFTNKEKASKFLEEAGDVWRD